MRRKIGTPQDLAGRPPSYSSWAGGGLAPKLTTVGLIEIGNPWAQRPQKAHRSEGAYMTITKRAPKG